LILNKNSRPGSGIAKAIERKLRFVNFFGHVVVATWFSGSPALALGSMLPDFAHMCRGRVVRARAPDMAAGIELHHRTDKAFHCLASFGELEREASRTLGKRGVARGSAMGTAHVAVELLLDGELLDDERACALYLAALAHEEATAPEPDIVWAEPEQIARWHALRARLREHGVPEGYRDPDTVAARVGQILSRRASLALSERDQRIVGEEMVALKQRVAARVPDILAELRAAMAGTPMLR
jgi:acyl carrier protein phosphodiesterase